MQDAGVQFYFRHNEETARQAKVLTRDEARRMGHPMPRDLDIDRAQEVAIPADEIDPVIRHGSAPQPPHIRQNGVLAVGPRDSRSACGCPYQTGAQALSQR
jgi:hypothetical protein